GPQPPQRNGSALPRRRSAHTDAEDRAGAGGRAGAGPFHCHARAGGIHGRNGVGVAPLRRSAASPRGDHTFGPAKPDLRCVLDGSRAPVALELPPAPLLRLPPKGDAPCGLAKPVPRVPWTRNPLQRQRLHSGRRDWPGRWVSAPAREWTTMKLRSLAELKTLQKVIAQRAAAEAAAQEAERRRLIRLDREKRLFELA